jgi:hypothetical protein
VPAGGMIYELQKNASFGPKGDMAHKTDDIRLNVAMRRVRVTIVAEGGKKQ